jgi:diguanylate cyclase (GGDEF)-like protein/PAS domain S-box-containing protein
MRLDLFPIAAILADRNGIIRCANVHAAGMFGFTVDEMAGLPVNMLLPAALRGRHDANIHDFFSSPTKTRAMGFSQEFSVCRKDNTTFPADISLSVVVEDGETFALVCIIDLTTHISQRNALAQTRRALDFLSSSNRALLRAREMQPLLDEVCRLATEIGGYRLAWIGYADHGERKLVRPLAQAGDNLDCMDSLVVSWADDERGRGPTGMAIRTGRPAMLRTIMTDPNYAPWRQAARDYGLQSAIALPLRVDDKVFGALMLYAAEPDAFDEEETKLLMEVADDLAFGIEVLRTREAHHQANKELRRLAYTDDVTELPNRAHLLDFLDGAFARQQDGALLCIALEHFKEINDTQGYLVGDALLKTAGERLASTLQTGEMLARIGDEEFALAVPGGDQAAAAKTATTVVEALRKTLLVGGDNIILSAKIGIALYPGGRTTPSEVCADAGLASRDAKASGNEGYRFYSPQMSAALMERRAIAQALKHAMTHGGLQLHYQPKIDLRSGKIAGAEALLRWRDPVRGQIAPDRFIPIAEERGLMPALGNWVLEEACRQMARWKKAGLHLPGRLSVNISAKQLDNAHFISTVQSIVEASGCSSADIELEITEGVMLSDSPTVLAMLEEINATGFVFAIDDFGTGFSSLAYLSRFPAGTLKIDICFVRNMLRSQKDYTLVKTIIGMAKGLGLATVAEGVETAEQARALLELGCVVAQGYYYGRPKPSEAFARRWLNVASPLPEHVLSQLSDWLKITPI